jgi:hypothetical protein
MYRYHDHIGILAKRGRISGKRKKPMHESEVENLSPERPQMQWADSRILCWTGWGAILVLAIWFRVLPIGSGLPYSDYIYEGHVLHQTIDAFNHCSLDVSWYGLPSLPAYCAGAILLLYGPAYHHFHVILFKKTCHKSATWLPRN